MPATVLADIEHTRSTQIADDTPHSAACQEERFGEVAYSAVLVCCDTEQHGAVAGDVVPAAIGTGRELRLPHIAPPESITRSSNYTQTSASLRAWTAAVKRSEERSKYYIESARSLCDSLVRRFREELAAMRPDP